MASDPSDPAADLLADYDYRGGDVARPGLARDLDDVVDGDVRLDDYSRALYATDASIYEATPVGVVFPRSTDDVAAAVAYCADRGIPVLPRGGGTSLAGQAVNEAVVLDFTRYMDAVVDVDPDGRRARAQPGVTLARLNDRLAEHDLKFAPDPAAGDRSVLGGAIGNNSTGAHSLQYGKTDAYVESCEVVLADGTVTTFGAVTLDELRDRADPDGDLEARIYAGVARVIDEHGDEVEAAYPTLKRNVSGYNLDWLLTDARGGERGAGEPDAPGDTVNLAKLLAGSEGTLAVVTEAEVSLEPVPGTAAMALLTYPDLRSAMADVPPILDHDPAAVELVDDVLLDLARETEEFRDVVAMLPGDARAVLLVEFYADDESAGRRRVAGLLADRAPHAEPEADPGGSYATADAPARATDALEAYEAADRERFWKLRKSGLPILLSRTSDEKHGSFVEDLAVPPEHLAAYVERFQTILDDHDTYASFYAHAGPGVLHVRPLVNTKTADGVATMESIADAATDLVVELGGSVSGEHGDGRARTQWNEKLYGPALWGAFRDLKAAFDPDWLLNPGQVCGLPPDDVQAGGGPDAARGADVGAGTGVGGDGADGTAGEAPGRGASEAPRMTDHLRMGPAYGFDAGFDPALAWENDNGLQGMVELCHGCGGCRGDQDTTGGVMCPTFRASREEVTATRGRANLLRRAMSGGLDDGDATDVEFMHEVLDLCVGCKGCARDCPSEVDLAKLKAEVTHEHHRRHGSSLRDRLFRDIDRLARVGSALAPLSNWAAGVPGSRALLERAVGVAADRSLPTFRRESLQDWFADRGGSQVPAGGAERRAVLFPDTYTNYSHPDIGRAAVRVLEAAGVHVAMADRTDSGRPAYSKGFLDHARATARATVEALAPRVRVGWDVVVVEPSDAVMLQSDYLDLLPGEDAETLAAGSYGVLEYLDRFRLDDGLAVDADDGATVERLTYHGHCHQKATKRDHHAVGVLRRAGYEVDPLDSGCCGMAGSFGYEAEHFSMSRAIGRILFDQVQASPGDVVVAPGASCRTQLGDWDGTEERPAHPVEKLAETLPAGE